MYCQAESTSSAPVTSDDLCNMERKMSGRAVPVRHLVIDSSLQNLINDIQPSDGIDEHVMYETNKGGGKKRLMFCKYCGVRIMHRHQFRRHIKLHPEVDYKPFHCPMCDYKAQIKAQLARHINIHGNAKPFVCTECGRGFNFKQKLQTHMKYHEDIRDQICPFCNQAFHEFKTLRNHVRNVHSVENASELLHSIQCKRVTSVAPVEIDGEASKSPTCQINADIDNSNKLLASGKPSRLMKMNAGDELFPLTDDGQNRQNITAVLISKTGDLSTTAADGELTAIEIDLTMCNREHEYKLEAELCEVSGDDVNFQEKSLRAKAIDVSTSASVVSSALPRKITKASGTYKTAINTELFRCGMLPRGFSSRTQYRNTRRTATGGRNFFSSLRTRLIEVIRPYCEITHRVSGLEEDKLTISCKLCCDKRRFVADTKTEFIHHLERYHTDVRPWSCDECSYRCRLQRQLLAHMKVHTGGHTNICELCGEGFALKQQLMKHLRQHSDGSEFSCSVCSKGFTEEVHLRNHHRRVHSECRPYVCFSCTKSFKDATQLRRHLLTHAPDKKFECTLCRKLYKSKVSLYQHMKSHNSSFQCEICDKAFGSYSGFMAHKIMHMESPTGYSCTICNKLLNTKGSIHRHYKVVHGSIRAFKCELCSKSFKTKKDLQSHRIVHSSEKKFECVTCSYQCKRIESLRVHMRVHAAIKPYRCILCHRQYTQKQPLDLHIARHIAKQPSSCVTCGVEFDCGDEVIKHLCEQHGHTICLTRVAQSDNAGHGQNMWSSSETIGLLQSDECVPVIHGNCEVEIAEVSTLEPFLDAENVTHHVESGLECTGIPCDEYQLTIVASPVTHSAHPGLGGVDCCAAVVDPVGQNAVNFPDSGVNVCEVSSQCTTPVQHSSWEDGVVNNAARTSAGVEDMMADVSRNAVAISSQVCSVAKGDAHSVKCCGSDINDANVESSGNSGSTKCYYYAQSSTSSEDVIFEIVTVDVDVAGEVTVDHQFSDSGE